MATRSGRAQVAHLIGQRIRTLREAQIPKMSQEKLARLAGVSTSTIYRAEAGGMVPEWETLERIAKALGASLGDLLEWGDTRVIPGGYPPSGYGLAVA